jgi:hypothetical protein
MVWFAHQKIAKNMSLLKKVQVHLQVLLLFKALIIMFSKCFWVFFIH